MISIVALYAGLVGMFGLWVFAWWLWNQANASKLTALDLQKEPTAVHQHSRARSVGEAEPKAAPLECEQSDEAPVVRERPSSDASTSFFSRSAIDSVAERSIDKTDLLQDDGV